MNVRFEYLYRDASNYLQRGSVVFAGPEQLDAHLPELENRLRRVLIVDGTFSAHQIRLPELFLYVGVAPSPDDHCLHEFFGLEATTDNPMTDSGDDFPSSWMKLNALRRKAGWDLVPTAPHRPGDTSDFRHSARAVCIGQPALGRLPREDGRDHFQALCEDK